ncbi:MAG: hypothetical protein ACREFW_05000 [Rhizomicrobium sp.]
MLQECQTLFKYPAEDECLVRRLGSAGISSWGTLPEAVRDKLLAQARAAWDREYYVSHLGDKLEAVVRRREK